MGYEVIIADGVEQDVDEAILWYEEQQTGLGSRFYSCLLEKLEQLKTTPQHYSFINDDYRRIVVNPFPYNVIYKIAGSIVLVFAVFHQSRNPAELLKRIKK